MQCQSNELDYLPKSIDKMEKLENLKVKLLNIKFSAKLRKFSDWVIFCGIIFTFPLFYFF